MNPTPAPASPVVTLIAELERAARILPRASPLETESMLAELTSVVHALGRATAVPPSLARRARDALGAFAGAIAILKARNDARLDALLHASRPAAGYDGHGQFSRAFDANVHSSA